MMRLRDRLGGFGARGVRALPLVVALMAGGLFADEVHVVEKAAYGSSPETLSDTTKYTGSDYTTQTAPTYGGYIFTHWSTSDSHGIDNRDVFGRARDVAKYHLCDTTTLTANYVDASLDSDGDGIADGYELYWYGNLNQNASSDTDGDGYTFAQELQYGMNPHFANAARAGVVYEDSDEHLYNPEGYAQYTIRSEPEGELFATITGFAKPGTTLTTPTCSRLTSFFGYWAKNGTVERDVFGRAKDQLSFTMPDAAVECVAVVVDDDIDREKLYWYGTTSVSLDSDTDGDGMTLAEEIAAGSNPLMPNKQLAGVVYSETEAWQYNPNNKHQYVIRSEPEGELFETQTGYAAPGATVTTPTCSKSTSFFSYWALDGARQSDVFGRAKDQLAFEMPSEDVEAVAVVVDDDTLREQMYWYGSEQSLDSDTDGDGMTFAEEIAAGSNPLMPNRQLAGVVEADSEDHEMNLQIYEQPQGALVGDAYEQLFYSPIAGNGATSITFGESKFGVEVEGCQIWPVVADVTGDGLWDLIVVSEVETNVFVNVGSKGNPQFQVAACEVTSSTGGDGETVLRVTHAQLAAVDLLMNSTAKLAAMTLDVEPVGALSATTNGATMLVSDEEGRIWLYKGTEATEGTEGTSPASTGDSTGEGDSSLSSLGSLKSLSYSLQHKVWGGSYAGFAQGLRLAAVDWEDDGDLDCLCGTAEGKLMLLRDPKVGRPTNLKALTGADNVNLTWDPNAQSRVRGYKVYRKGTEATEGTEGTTPASTGDSAGESDSSLSSLESFTSLGFSSLPTYRDYPPNIAAYDYKVSSVSRFYTAGNSTPTESESMPTEAVRANLGSVSLAWHDASACANTNAEVMLSIDNSLGLAAEATLVVGYDPAVLEFVAVEKSGITEAATVDANVSFASNEGGASPSDAIETIASTGRVTIVISNGQLADGQGTFLSLVFRPTAAAKATLLSQESLVSQVSLASATLLSTASKSITVLLPEAAAKVTLLPAQNDPTVVPPYSLGDIDGDGHLTILDLRLLAKLKSTYGRKYNANQLAAGDFNGNGKLDNADYQALRALLKERGLL